VNWLALLKLILTLAAWVARQVDKAASDKAFGDALILSHEDRVAGAAAARDDVVSGRVPVDPNDPNRRD